MLAKRCISVSAKLSGQPDLPVARFAFAKRDAVSNC
jgi:hypothetical protein